MNCLNILTALLAFTLGIGTSCLADSKSESREYRPLEAKKVFLRPGANGGKAGSGNLRADALMTKAWSHFEKEQWAEAIDSFLSVVEIDPTSEEAGEGLAMSVYRSGDLDSAYRLAHEISRIMPSVRRVMEGAVYADVRELIREDKLEEARSLVSHFPQSGDTYADAHDMVRTTRAIAGALDPGGDTTADPNRLASR